MSEEVRLTCPAGRKQGETWVGIGLLLLGVVVLVLSSGSWVTVAAGVALAGVGTGLSWHGFRIARPVLELVDGEFRYRRGRYIVRLPFAEVGSYYVLPGRTRSLGLCDLAGRPRLFPSVEGRRATRPYLPLTGLTSPARVESFMSAIGIPQRDRSLTSGSPRRRPSM